MELCIEVLKYLKIELAYGPVTLLLGYTQRRRLHSHVYWHIPNSRQTVTLPRCPIDKGVKKMWCTCTVETLTSSIVSQTQTPFSLAKNANLKIKTREKRRTKSGGSKYGQSTLCNMKRSYWNSRCTMNYMLIKVINEQGWWHTPSVPAFGMQRQADL